MNRAASAPLQTGSVLPLARYRFCFRMEDELRLPEYAGSLLRGQLGAALRRTACMTGARECTGCPLYRTCPYPAIFETPPPDSHPLQDFSQVPNPYVIEPPAIGTRNVPANAVLSFNVVLAGRTLSQLPLIAFALQRAFGQGIGRLRTRATLQDITYERGDGAESVWDTGNSHILPHRPCLAIPAMPEASAITLNITTPLRLQHQGRPISPENLAPRTLITALLRRASLLFDIHADMPGIVGDAAALARQAEQLTDSRQLTWKDWTRFSSRQKQEMTLGGVIGEWSLRGDLAPFLPWLWLGQWLHVGKNATMGMGKYSLMWDCLPCRGLRSRFARHRASKGAHAMQTLKLRVSVRNHRIAEELPPEVPDGEAEVVIHYEEKSAEGVEQARRRHLEALFARVRQHSPNRSRENIERQLAEERASWGE